MANPLFGKNMSFFYDSSVVSCTTDFDLEISKNTQEIPKCLGETGYMDHEADFKSWSASFNGMVRRTDVDASTLDYDNLMFDVMNKDTSVNVSIRPSIASNKYYDGYGIITSLSQSSAAGASPVTFSGNIQGTGPLTLATV